VWTSVIHVGRWPASKHLVVFGSSMGAAAVLRAAALHELPVDALILQAPFASLTEAVGHRFDNMHAPRFPAAPLLVFWGGYQRGFDAFAHAPARYAEDVHEPVLLMQGERDPLACVREARAIHDRLRGRKELVLFPKASHQSLFRADRPRWRRAVQGFLGA
jgi:alpha-beta hydrolase superfamily lysophospholipase